MNNKDPKYIFPLQFGISLQDINTKIHKNITYNIKKTSELYYNFIPVQEHPYDCGCLIIGNLNICDKETLSYVEKFASLSGYYKIIGTIVSIDLNRVFIKTLQKANYTFIDTGPSNRHPEYNSWLIYKVIKPEIKGYV